MFKLAIILSILIAAASAGYEVTSQHQNILRSYGNLGQISTYSKSIDTPFSSVRKADVRVSNPGLTIATPVAHAAYAAPIAHAAYPAFAPAVAHAPLLPHAPFVGPVAKAVAPAGLLGVAYSAAPTVAHMTYTNGLGVSYAW
ncbi:unnamed protein product [Hermetia illucens]|uniref:Pupal cuticle protein C1B n=1 Tax=Hermetia illucens TaxID=343691 RepID=A0A7R8YWC9_HERIL|nr:pupal cuticle protein C1B-like [Hermetia illucens]CAD7088283.1 unnamed protein product [Hermetia illucens]